MMIGSARFYAIVAILFSAVFMGSNTAQAADFDPHFLAKIQADNTVKIADDPTIARQETQHIKAAVLPHDQVIAQRIDLVPGWHYLGIVAYQKQFQKLHLQCVGTVPSAPNAYAVNEVWSDGANTVQYVVVNSTVNYHTAGDYPIRVGLIQYRTKPTSGLTPCPASYQNSNTLYG